MKTDVAELLKDKYHLETKEIEHFVNFVENENATTQPYSIKDMKQILTKRNVSGTEQLQLLKMVKGERSLSRKIGRLELMKKYFKYWHVAHIPFALIMLFIVIIHVIVSFTFGYKWIF